MITWNFFPQIIGFDMFKIRKEKSFLENLFLAQFLAIFRKILDLFDIIPTKIYSSDIDLRSSVHFCPHKHMM